MATTIDSTSRLTVRNGNETLLDFGSNVTPTNTTAGEGTAVHGPRTITLEPGDSFTLWDWATDGDLAILELKTSAFIWIAQKVDAPTDAEADPPDYTPAGTAVNYPKEGVSCIGTHRIQGMAVPVAASSSNYAGSAFHASVANGRRYTIVAKNPADAESDATITWAWCR